MPNDSGTRVWSEGRINAIRTCLICLRAAFSGRILPFTDTTAVLCAALHVPKARSDRDAMIAATALEHGMHVVARNEADFAETKVKLLNPFLQ